jgi:uncharacterized membrane protein
VVITAEELAALTDQERTALARLLREVSGPRPALTPPRPRLVFALVSALCAIALVSWIVVLGLTLPPNTPGGAWRASWIGFDAVEAASFTMTAWAAWRRRQMAIPASVVTGTLLLCDAWFDVTLSWGSTQQWPAILSAAVIEVPVALLLFRASAKMAHLSMSVARSSLGFHGPTPALHRLLLFDPLFDDSRPADSLNPSPELTTEGQ